MSMLYTVWEACWQQQMTLVLAQVDRHIAKLPHFPALQPAAVVSHICSPDGVACCVGWLWADPFATVIRLCWPAPDGVPNARCHTLPLLEHLHIRRVLMTCSANVMFTVA